MATTLLLMMIGRVVFGGFFVIAGVRNFLNFGDRRQIATNYGWKLPAPVMALGFAVQLVCGLGIILGLWTALSVLLLIGFLVVATALYHNPFMFSGKARDPHLYLTLVNITLAAGLLLVMANSLG